MASLRGADTTVPPSFIPLKKMWYNDYKKQVNQMLDIALLGTGGMIPLHNRYLSALLARYNGHMLLIDCGEGSQVTMRELG